MRKLGKMMLNRILHPVGPQALPGFGQRTYIDGPHAHINQPKHKRHRKDNIPSRYQNIRFERSERQLKWRPAKCADQAKDVHDDGDNKGQDTDNFHHRARWGRRK